MKTLLVSCIAAALTIGSGCGKESEEAPAGAPEAKKFSITVPTIATGVKQGARETAKIKVNRGAEMKDKVTLKFTPPTGLTVDPMTAEVAADAKETEITIEAAADAPPGDQNIGVEASSAAGGTVTQKIPVDVKAKD